MNNWLRTAAVLCCIFASIAVRADFTQEELALQKEVQETFQSYLSAIEGSDWDTYREQRNKFSKLMQNLAHHKNSDLVIKTISDEMLSNEELCEHAAKALSIQKTATQKILALIFTKITNRCREKHKDALIRNVFIHTDAVKVVQSKLKSAIEPHQTRTLMTALAFAGPEVQDYVVDDVSDLLVKGLATKTEALALRVLAYSNRAVPGRSEAKLKTILSSKEANQQSREFAGAALLKNLKGHQALFSEQLKADNEVMQITIALKSLLIRTRRAKQAELAKFPKQEIAALLSHSDATVSYFAFQIIKHLPKGIVSGMTDTIEQAIDSIVHPVRYDMMAYLDEIDALEMSAADKQQHKIQNAIFQLKVSNTLSQYYRWRSSVQLASGSGDGRPPLNIPNFTKTNNQVKDVEELDSLKSNGKYTYIRDTNGIQVYQTWPINERKHIANIRYDEEWEFGDFINGMFLHNNHLVIARNELGYGSDKNYLIEVFDVTNPNNPQHLSSVQIADAMFVGARRIGDNVYFLTKRRVDEGSHVYVSSRLGYTGGGYLIEADPYFRPFDEQDKAWRMSLVREVVQDYLAEDFFDNTVGQSVTSNYKMGDNWEPMFDIENLVIPSVVNESSVLHISRLDLRDMSRIETVAILGGGDELYVSTENIYVAFEKRNWGMWGWTIDESATTIHKIAMNDPNDGMSYRASVKIPGLILNQFSMDEHDGYFRIATTDWSEGELLNHIFVMGAEEGQKLQIVGKINNIAPTERVTGVRFMGDLAYLVTFRLVDPLFVIDMTTPSNPEILGELKIDGFSNYVHRLDENHLLTTGYLEGKAQLQVFDVSNNLDPQLKHRVVLFDDKGKGFIWYNRNREPLHKMFMFDSVNGILSMPVSFYDRDKPARERYGQAAFVYKIDATEGFKHLGDIHAPHPHSHKILKTFKIGDYLYAFYDKANGELPLLYHVGGDKIIKVEDTKKSTK